MTRVWIVTLVLITACSVECRICTRMTLEKRVQTVKYQAECHQSYEARCGWFSVKTCTFNETVPCMKEDNRTISVYRIVEDCCPGYHRDSEGKCSRGPGKGPKDGEPEKPSHGTKDFSDAGVKGTVTVSYNVPKVRSSSDSSQQLPNLSKFLTGDSGIDQEDISSPKPPQNVTGFVDAGVEGIVTVTAKGDSGRDQEDISSQKPQNVTGFVDAGVEGIVTVTAKEEGGRSSNRGYDDDGDKFFLGISHGAYAGIICGILFVACVALLTALHYRKRRRRQAKKNSPSVDQDAAQKPMIAMEKIESHTVDT